MWLVIYNFFFKKLRKKQEYVKVKYLLKQIITDYFNSQQNVKDHATILNAFKNCSGSEIMPGFKMPLGIATSVIFLPNKMFIFETNNLARALSCISAALSK